MTNGDGCLKQWGILELVQGFHTKKNVDFVQIKASQGRIATAYPNAK